MIKRALLAASALAASTLVVAAPAAHAAPCDFGEDITNPTYVSSTVAPSAVVVGKIKRTIKVTVTAADACGVEDVDVMLSIKGNSSAGSIYVYGFALVSGSAQNGTWAATKVLSDYEQGGTYVPSEIDIWDVNINKSTKLYGSGSLQVRHATTTTLSKPASKVKKGKKVTLKGRVTIAGDFHTTKATIQARTSKSKPWITIKSVSTDFFGDYSTKVKVTKTKYYRVIHKQDGITAPSASRSYKVKKK